MRVLGPNIVGTLSNSDNLNASFAPFLPFPGKATLISQSGALLIALDASSFSRRVGFDKLISIGNMSDVDFADIINWLNVTPIQPCVSLYIEGFKERPAHSLRPPRRATKPIIALKIRRVRAWRGRGSFSHRLIGRRCQSLWRGVPAGRRHPGH